MTRYKSTPDGQIPFTAQEEAERDAEEAEWAADAVNRAKAKKQRELETEFQRLLTIEIPDAGKREHIEVIKIIWANLHPQAKQPTQKLTDIITLHGKADTARADIEALTTVVDVETFDVVAALA